MPLKSARYIAFQDESLVFEIKRIRVLIFIFGLVSILSVLNLMLAERQVLRYFSSMENYSAIIWVSVFFLVFLVLRYLRVQHYQKRGLQLPSIYQWISATMEISFPTIALVTVISLEGKASLVDSPAFLFYFIFIISSIFYLRPKVSLWSGLIAGASYSIIIQLEYTADMDFPIVAYHARSFLLLAGGVIAAAVAHEVRQRITLAIKNAAEYERVEALFNQQVSPEIVRALKETQQETRVLEVTVMFLDIRGFTKKVEYMSPEEINQFQNDVLGPMIEIINQHHGVVNQLLGDGFMASFGAPLEREDHAIMALRSASDIFNHLQNSQDLSVNVGIGMHSGKVVTGNIGTKDRQQYSISGTTVIVAARLEQLNKEYESSCLVSAEFFEAASKEIADHHKLGETSIKGISSPVQIIQLK